MANTNMYFEDNRDLAHDRQEIRVNLVGETLHFATDSGVFSKSQIDYGSRVLIENFAPTGKTLLDVGSGYGVIGLTLAKKYNLSATLVDVNARALELSAENSEKNNLSAEVLLSDGYAALAGRKFDNVVSNPPIRAGKEVVHHILSGAAEHLSADGLLWIVIQKKQGAPSAQKKMQEVFGNCEIVARDKGYYILRSRK